MVACHQTVVEIPGSVVAMCLFILGSVVGTVFAGRGALTALLTVPQIAAVTTVGRYAWHRPAA
jgi:hypothetical protein